MEGGIQAMTSSQRKTPRIIKCCGFGMFLPDPDFYPSRILIFTHPGSRIPDPKTGTKERGEQKFVVIPFFVATNFTKFYFWNAEEKNLSQFSKNYRTFYQETVPKLSKIWVRDPGPRVKKAPDPGSGSATLELLLSGYVCA
jgi:hypothetical protein